MATLSHPPPTLEVTTAGDDMELSSDAGRFDNDIDIDFDVSVDNQQSRDLDYMLEDIRSEAERSFQDQDMQQDDDVAFVDSGAMTDTIDFDEDIGDAIIGDAGPNDLAATNAENHQSNTAFDGRIAEVSNDFSSAGIPLEVAQNTRVIELLGQDAELQPSEQPPAVIPGTSTVSNVTKFSPNPIPISQGHDAKEEYHFSILEQDSTNEPPDQAGPPSSAPAQKQELSEGFEAHGPVPKEHDQHAQTVFQTDNLENAVASSADQTDQTANESLELEVPSDDGFMHPTIVIYEENEISLFPPRDEDSSEVYFLEDVSLASQSISNLLKACREVLGETIHDEEELQIEIAELDLTIGEESAHATSTSFAELLEVFVDLHRLDGTDEDAAPMYVTLTRKTRFSARLSSLREAIADGRGFSQLWYRDDDEEYFAQDDADGQAANVISGEEHHVNDEAEAKGSASIGQGVKSGDSEAGTAYQDQDDEHEEEGNLEEQDGLFDLGQEHLATLATTTVSSEVDQAKGGETAISTQDTAVQEGEEEEEEQLIDYEDEEDETRAREENDSNRSTGSSTIVGDASTGPGARKADEASASQPGTAQAQEIRGPGAHEDELLDHDDSTAFEIDAGVDNEPTGTFEETNRYDAAEDLQDPDDCHNYEVGSYEQENDTGTASEDLIDWADGPTDNIISEHDPSATEALAQQEPTEYAFDEDFDTSLDNNDVGEAWTDDDRTLTAQQDLAASTETVVGGLDARTEAEESNTAVDAFDEINFDDVEEEGYEEGEVGDDDDEVEPGAAAGHPSESPPGKRSWTEHLGGDDEDGSDQGSKRLRSS